MLGKRKCPEAISKEKSLLEFFMSTVKEIEQEVKRQRNE